MISNYLRNHELAFSAIDLAMEFGSPESIKRAVAAGLGISVLSVATLDKELSLNLLAKTSLNPALTRPFSIVYQRQKFRLRAMEEFLLFIQEHCERISSES